MQPMNVESPGHRAPARLGPATLLCPAPDLRDSMVLQLLELLCESGICAGLVPLVEISGELAAHGVLAVAHELFLGEPLPFHALRGPGEPSRSRSALCAAGEGATR